MAIGQRIGHVRVSTVEQNLAGQLADQRDTFDKVFIDHVSGSTIQRPQGRPSGSMCFGQLILS